MKKLTEAEILKLIKQDDEINFLAAAITPLHALGIEAAIYHLLQNGLELKGYIMLVAHPITGYALVEADFHILKDVDIELVQLSDEVVQRNLLEKLRDKKEIYNYYLTGINHNMSMPMFYYITPYKPSFNLIPEVAGIKKNYCLNIIITDEGLASYLRNPYELKKGACLEWGIIGTLKNVWNILIEEKFFLWRMKKKGVYSEFVLLHGKSGRWKRNEACVSAYKEILSRDKNVNDFSYYENAVVINPSPLYESKILKERVDIPIYKAISQQMKKQEINVIAKPHPREQQQEWYEELECIIEKKSNIGQENIFAKLSVYPKYVISESSSTLVTASILYGIKAISINKLIERKYLRDPHYFDSFNKTFSNLVLIPETMEELMDILHHD